MSNYIVTRIMFSRQMGNISRHIDRLFNYAINKSLNPLRSCR